MFRQGDLVTLKKGGRNHEDVFVVLCGRGEFVALKELNNPEVFVEEVGNVSGDGEQGGSRRPSPALCRS